MWFLDSVLNHIEDEISMFLDLSHPSRGQRCYCNLKIYRSSTAHNALLHLQDKLSSISEEQECVLFFCLDTLLTMVGCDCVKLSALSTGYSPSLMPSRCPRLWGMKTGTRWTLSFRMPIFTSYYRWSLSAMRCISVHFTQAVLLMKNRSFFFTWTLNTSYHAYKNYKKSVHFIYKIQCLNPCAAYTVIYFTAKRCKVGVDK